MMTKQYTKAEIDFLVQRFEERILPKVEWTHSAHLIVALLYSLKFSEQDALNLVRENIKKHNESVGTPNTDNQGYHETITRFWLWTANQFLLIGNYNSIVDASNDLINSAFGKSSYPFEYYTKDLLFSVKARHDWVEPDLYDLTKFKIPAITAPII
jgi:hypothetical protein